MSNSDKKKMIQFPNAFDRKQPFPDTMKRIFYYLFSEKDIRKKEGGFLSFFFLLQASVKFESERLCASFLFIQARMPIVQRRWPMVISTENLDHFPLVQLVSPNQLDKSSEGLDEDSNGSLKLHLISRQ